MSVSQFFPEELRTAWYAWDKRQGELFEIRLRVNYPVRLHTAKGECLLKDNKDTPVIYSERELDMVFRHLCHDSVYAYEQERRQGYMMLAGGHRAGITGELVYQEGQGFTAKYIRYINIRLAHQIQDTARLLMPFLYEGEQPCSTLLISPPGIGKTTLLRDIVRNFSNGCENHAGLDVGLVDERGELAGAYRGSAALDCGMRTDVITGGDKSTGVRILVRTFAPRVIALDEIGSAGDAQAVLYAGVSGCAVAATAHGSSVEDIARKKDTEELIRRRVFQRYAVLDRNTAGERTIQLWNGEGRELCGKRQLREY